MAKKLHKEINRLTELPDCINQQDFMDKLINYLYVRFKFKLIEVLPADDIEESGEYPFLIKLQDKLIEQISEVSKYEVEEARGVYIPFQLQKQARYLYLGIGKRTKFFREYTSFIVYCKTLALYLNTVLMGFQQETMKVEQVREEAPPKLIKSPSFYELDVKKIPDRINLVSVLEDIERKIIREMLEREQGKKITTAKRLGITERMIGYKVKKLGLW